MSAAIFQQKGARAHASKKAKEWLRENFQNFWPKGIWTANSPDLSLIENLWSIIQLPSIPLSRQQFEKQLISAWGHNSHENLTN